MPIKLDHVGLNTLIQEPVSSSTNTVGYEQLDIVENRPNKALVHVSHGSSQKGLTGEAVPTYPNSSAATHITIAFWLRMDASTSDTDSKYIIEADGGSGNIFMLYIDEGYLFLDFYKDSGSTERRYRSRDVLDNAEYNLDQNTWNHFAIIYSNTDITQIPELYINGIQDTTGTITSGIRHFSHIPGMGGATGVGGATSG